MPSFTKDLFTARRPINARPETLAASGMFKGALQARRCLVPAGTVRLWPVSRAVNSVRNNGPELLEPMVDGGRETPEEARVDINAA